MKNQALFSSKDKSKQLKCRLLQFLFGALRVTQPLVNTVYSSATVSIFQFETVLQNPLLGSVLNLYGCHQRLLDIRK